jgi:hypothetical protein
MKHWIFQGNSKTVDDIDRLRDDCLATGRTRYRLDWTVKWKADIQIGDQAAIWSAGGGGVIAIGQVIGEPFEGVEFDDGYWIDRDWFAGLRTFAPLGVVWLDQPVGRDMLKNDPIFAQSLIIKSSGKGKNPFPVSDVEWAVIAEMAGQTA